MAPDTTLLHQIYDPANRANPYPLFARLRETPVCWQEDGPDAAGTYVVSTYRELVAVLHDPRLSSDLRNSPELDRRMSTYSQSQQRAFIATDPPEHDRLRRLAMRHFGPPQRPEYLEQLRPEVLRIVNKLIDDLDGNAQIDFVERFAYPLPVTVICRILGVPLEDEPRFHQWSRAIVEAAGSRTEAERQKRGPALAEMREYMLDLVKRRRTQPGDDLLSRMATDDGTEGRMDDADLAATGVLLLIAGHETTVNLLGNGLLTLLRYPMVFNRLRNEPDLIPSAVEEVLRYEPPVQLLSNRTTLDEITLRDTTIPRGVLVTLALAAANRDPTRFANPDRFEPDRRDNSHLGFGSGIHSCFGAPLARMEAQVAFPEILRRLSRPRLVVDPPPYRLSPTLRGPEHLLIEVEGIHASKPKREHRASAS